MFTALAITALVLSVAAGTYSTINNYQNAKAQQKAAEANAQLAEQEAQAQRNAEAMNASQMRREARQKIAAAKARYAAEGNIGESADATVEDAYVNLASDLSALRFNYENKAIQAENESLMYSYNAKVSGMNKTSSIIGGTLNTAASGASFATSAYAAGATLSSGAGGAGKVTGYTGAVSDCGMYGATP